MIDKERIKAEAEAFFEWPSKEKTYVTTTSMLIFANAIAEMARAEEREACASICEQRIRNAKHSEFMIGADHEARAIVDAIRARSNAWHQTRLPGHSPPPAQPKVTPPS